MSLFCSRNDEAQPRKKMGCLGKLLIGLGIYIVFTVLSAIWISSLMNGPSVKLKDHSVYKLTMKGIVVEQAADANPFDAIVQDMPVPGYDNQTKVGLNQLLSNIRLAKEDDRIEGIYLSGAEFSMGAATAKTIRDALLDFKESGKWIIAYAESYDTYNYYVATAADKIYLNPVGAVRWHGFGAFKMYYTRALEKLGVEMQIVKVGTFKSAVEPFFRTSMSEADKKQTMSYLQGLWNEVVKEVSAGRGISTEALNRYADEFMDIQPQEKYLEYGFVDSLVYIQGIDSLLVNRLGKDYHSYTTAQLQSVERDKPTAKDLVAVVYAEGDITDNSGDGIVGTKMVKTLGKVAKNEDVKAVVLRVNSGGGSADASEQIWHAVQVLREKGLPVVVSMGDYAASGGYYISCGADYIIAEPTTITGSIGIFGLIPNAGKLRDKIGIDIDALGTNKRTTMAAGMGLKPMTPEEYQLMQTMVERGYDLFTNRCAEGRGMTQDEIKKIGEGRVWLGTDALQLGLVDSLGNLNDAIKKAAALAGLEEYAKVAYPFKKSYWEELLASFDHTTDEQKLLMKIKDLCAQPRIMAKMPEVIIK